MGLPLNTLSLPLFVPADRPERFSKAIEAGPDAVFIDLEDAVAPDSKAGARDALWQHLQRLQPNVPLAVRVNAIGTPWHDDDLAAISRLPLAAVVLPKAESAEAAKAVSARTRLPVVALVESAEGLGNVREIARHCARIAFGSIDYAADLAMGHTRSSLLAARSEIVLASRLAGIPAPIDGVTTAIRDDRCVIDDCAHAAELGFGGKLLIHPAQIAPARRGFRPPEDEIAWARRVIDATSQGDAAIRVDGAMVDAPVLLRARQIIQRAGNSVP